MHVVENWSTEMFKVQMALLHCFQRICWFFTDFSHFCLRKCNLVSIFGWEFQNDVIEMRPPEVAHVFSRQTTN